MKKKTSNTKKVVKGVAIAGALAGAAYMLMGPDGKKNQAKLKKFAGKVKNVAIKDAKMVMKTASKAKKMVMKDVKVVKKNVKKTVAQVKKIK